MYKFFKNKFKAGDERWTSGLPVHHDLPAFDGDEATTSDFTISNPLVCARITDWLIENGHKDSAARRGTNVTYHFEVKATSGLRDEPFSISNNQIDLVSRYSLITCFANTDTTILNLGQSVAR